jgi:glycosyltransferase involved in cell wall biosynthesis
VVYRAASIVGPAFIEPLLARYRPVVFDFDDAIFMTDTTLANRRFGWLKFAGKTGTICRVSTHVVVGNDFLERYARRYNDRVTIVPSSVDTDLYTPMPSGQPRGDVVIGWMGSSTSQAHLELHAEVLAAFAGRRGVEIRIVSDRPPQLPGIPVSWRPWSAARELDELRQFDVGIMPMPDDPWSRGKCAMKALLYMSVGAPAICSPVGMNRQVIRHGENGLLANTPAEWVAHIARLIDDVEYRRKLGMAARRTVEEGYSMRQCAASFGRVIRDAATAGPRA